MSIVLVGSTSGSITLQEPAVAGSTVLDLPATSGTVALTSQLLASPSAVGQIPFSTDGSTYTAIAKIVSGTAVASTSGTSIDFTGIPSWVKRITVLFNGVSTNGSSNPIVQIGTSSGVTTSGYAGYAQWGVTRTAMSSGFMWSNFAAAGSVFGGILVITNVTSNTWAELGNVADSGSGQIVCTSAGSIGLSGTLDRVRITTTNGTDTFDAGTINILYE